MESRIIAILAILAILSSSLVFAQTTSEKEINIWSFGSIISALFGWESFIEAEEIKEKVRDGELIIESDFQNVRGDYESIREKINDDEQTTDMRIREPGQSTGTGEREPGQEPTQAIGTGMREPGKTTDTLIRGPEQREVVEDSITCSKTSSHGCSSIVCDDGFSLRQCQNHNLYEHAMEMKEADMANYQKDIYLIDTDKHFPMDKVRCSKTSSHGCASIVCDDGFSLRQCQNHPRPEPVTETVSCVFESNESQSCKSEFGGCTAYPERICSEDGKCTFPSQISCIASVSGDFGQIIDWKSSCGDSAKTVINGNDKRIRFHCGSDKYVTETVSCVFESNESQNCQSELGGCTAHPKMICAEGGGCTTPSQISCMVSLTGKKGQTLNWKSSCGGYEKTLLDGKSKRIVFDCEEKQLILPGWIVP